MLELLKQVSDPRIRMDIVFAPLLGGDTLNVASNYMPINPDPRARVWPGDDHLLSPGPGEAGGRAWGPHHAALRVVHVRPLREGTTL